MREPSIGELTTAQVYQVCLIGDKTIKEQYPEIWEALLEVVSVDELEEAVKQKKDEQAREHQEYVKWQDQQDDYGEHEWEYSEPGYEEDWSDEEN